MKIFKVLSVMMIVALCAGFASCSNDDDKGDNTIVGTWEMVKEQVTVKKPDGTVQNKPEAAPDEVAILTFNVDNTGNVDYDGDKESFTWKLDGTKISIIYNGDEDVWEFEILNLDNNQAVLRDVFEDGNWTYTTTATYKKVK